MSSTTGISAIGAIPPHAVKTQEHSTSSSSSSIAFAADAGRTSPVLDRCIPADAHKERITGLKPWMVNCQCTLPALPIDTLSHAQPQLAVTTHLKWDVTNIDFKKRELTATATYAYRNKCVTDKETGASGNDKLVLDVKGLKIASVKIGGVDVPYEIVLNPDQKQANKYDALHITIPADKPSGDVAIDYTTSPDASGLFWIDPQFTTGKKHPLLYTLFEANEAASALPGQHSPQIRVTWEVNVNTGSPELMALSSVKNNPKVADPEGNYRGLYMDRRTPLYLLCLEVGNLAYQAYRDKDGNETNYGVYTEPVDLAATVEAFKKMPEFIAAAEKLFGPYKWGRYDGSVLCNAFPYSAMEHACKSTFGKVCMDKPEVIAHEITHSWLGNDITNATWFELFLNEGFTVWGEVMICAEVYGWDWASMSMISRIKGAEAAMKRYKDAGRPGVCSLVSDEAEFSIIPYGKGALFFFMLQNAIGKEAFAKFVKDYMNVFFQSSMSSERLVAFLKEWLKNELNITDFEKFKADNKIDEWLHGQNIPSNVPVFNSEMLNGLTKQAEQFVANGTLDVGLYRSWNEQMRFNFLGELTGKLSKEQMAVLDSQLGLSQCTTLMGREAWSRLCSNRGYITPVTREFMVRFVLERNSMALGDLITNALCTTAEGREVALEILRRGAADNCLFEVTRKKIQENIDNSLIELAANKFLAEGTVDAAAYASWDERERVFFVGKLMEKITKDQAASLDALLSLSEVTTPALKEAWTKLGTEVAAKEAKTVSTQAQAVQLLAQ